VENFSETFFLLKNTGISGVFADSERALGEKTNS
jgi:hypothetical protein